MIVGGLFLYNSDMKKVGILKEGKVPVDHRVAFTPKQLVELQSSFNVEVFVQKSSIRAHRDEDYLAQGLQVVDDVSHCDILFGVKEVPKTELIEGKVYFFFSHTIKAQPYNRQLLQTILQKNIQLVDYECLKNEKGQRVVAFGRFAGIVGAYNGLLTYGKKYNKYDLIPANKCFDMEALWNELSKVNLPAIKIALTGGGRVANGAIETLEKANIKQVSVQEFLTTSFQEPVFVQLDSNDYNERIDGTNFDESDFYKNPALYKSTFHQFIDKTDILIAGAYWDPEAPVLFTQEDVGLPDFSIRVVADITCDIEGSIPTTIRSTTIDKPTFDINRNTFEECIAYSEEDHITVMAVDNLPCELPRDASESFGQQLLNNVVKDLLVHDTGIIEKATIAKNGELMAHYNYLQPYVEG